MSNSPAFQFYPKDFLSGTLGMTLEEKGCYICLLCWCWDAGGELVNDDRTLAAGIGISLKAWRRLWKRLETKFVVSTVIRNRRIDEELVKQASFRVKQSEKGKASAQQRFNRGSTVVQPDTQPEFNHGSTGGVTGSQPEVNSSSAIYDLQTSVKARESAPPPLVKQPPAFAKPIGAPIPTLVNGLDARRHGQHVAGCDRGVCVDASQHAEFVARMACDGADDKLRLWYPSVLARYSGAIGDDRFAFWRNAFAEAYGTVTRRPSEPSTTTKGNASVLASERAGRILEQQAADGVPNIFGLKTHPKQLKGAK